MAPFVCLLVEAEGKLSVGFVRDDGRGSAPMEPAAQGRTVVSAIAVFAGPYSGGQSHHRQPLLMTNTMPLITRRSSTRALPRTSIGRSGSIEHHCSSLSQKRLDRIARPRSESTPRANQQLIQTTTVLLGPHPSYLCRVCHSPWGPTWRSYSQIWDLDDTLNFVERIEW